MNNNEQNQATIKLKKLKILFLTPRFTNPLIGGDRIKIFKIISYLALNNDVTFVSLYQGKQPAVEHLEMLKNLGIKVHLIKLNPFISGLRAALNIFRYPLEIGYYKQPKFARLVLNLIKEENYDLAFAFFLRTAEYIKDAQLKKFLMAEDCRTLYQKRSYQNTNNIKHKIIRYWEYHRLKFYESKITAKFDVTSLVTEEDILAMKQLNPEACYRLLTNGTDLKKYVPPENNEQRDGILFAGKLDLWANMLMIQRIAHKIFPKIKEAIPDSKFNIVGANPPYKIRSLASDSIKIFSNVPSLQPFYQQAKVFIHPHSAGTGIQNKLLEAMACGCPVVTTPIGIQGIPAVHGEDVLIGITDEELINLTISLLKDKELYEKISHNCRKLIEKSHSWDLIFKSLDKILLELFDSDKPLC